MKVANIAIAFFLLSGFAISQDRAAVITSSAKIYTKASKTSKVVVVVKKGAVVDVNGSIITNKFYPVIYGKHKGWMFTDDISLEGFWKRISQVVGDPIKQSDRDAAAREEALKKSQLELDNRKLDKWIQIQRGDVSTTYFNPSKILDNGDYREFWIKETAQDKEKYWTERYSNVSSIAEATPKTRFVAKFQNALLRYLADCKTRRLAFVQQVDYFTDGGNANFDLASSGVQMSSVIPDTVGEKMWSVACGVK